MPVRRQLSAGIRNCALGFCLAVGICYDSFADDNPGDTAVPLSQALQHSVKSLKAQVAVIEHIKFSGITFQESGRYTALSALIEAELPLLLTRAYDNILTGRRLRISRHRPQGGMPQPAVKPDRSEPHPDNRRGTAHRYTLSGRYWLIGKDARLYIQIENALGHLAGWRGMVRLGNLYKLARPKPGTAPRPKTVKAANLTISTNKGEKPEFNLGEKIIFTFTAKKDGWLYCFYRDAAGKITRILPPQHRQSLPIYADTPLIIGDRDFAAIRLRLYATEPAGREFLTCAVTEKDIWPTLPRDLVRAPGLPIAGYSLTALQKTFHALTGGQAHMTTLPIRILNAAPPHKRNRKPIGSPAKS